MDAKWQKDERPSVKNANVYWIVVKDSGDGGGDNDSDISNKRSVVM